ncbi:hypothetical protein Bbelb_370010 [Branchiostoma belcheri]|nr:hypothetical protein Bbelb_370010 [Branchiostoma belcheri]
MASKPRKKPNSGKGKQDPRGKTRLSFTLGPEIVEEEEDPMECENCASIANKKLIHCDCCEKWMCLKCQDVTADLIDFIGKFPSILWFCGNCRIFVLDSAKAARREKSGEGGADAEDSVSGFNARGSTKSKHDQQKEASVMETMSKVLTEISKKLDGIVGADGQSLKGQAYAEVVGGSPIQECSGSSEPARTARKIEEPGKLMSDSVEELMDREKRKLNIILHNVPEPASEDPTDRERLDREFIGEVARELGEPDVCVLKAVRLGKREPGRIDSYLPHSRMLREDTVC